MPAPIPVVAIVVQARMGATRLPGKPLLEVRGKPLLTYLIERLHRSKRCSKIIVATTVKKQDDPLANLAKSLGVEVFRGDENDVLSRFEQASKQVDVIVRITADCPLTDPALIDKAIEEFLEKKVDYLSNTQDRTFPRGLDIEVFSRQALEMAADRARLPSEREHVTPYFYNHPELFKLAHLSYKGKRAELRLTVDTKEDFELIQNLLEVLPPEFTFEEILKVMKEHPEWEKINQHIKQKNI